MNRRNFIINASLSVAAIPFVNKVSNAAKFEDNEIGLIKHSFADFYKATLLKEGSYKGSNKITTLTRENLNTIFNNKKDNIPHTIEYKASVFDDKLIDSIGLYLIHGNIETASLSCTFRFTETGKKLLNPTNNFYLLPIIDMKQMKITSLSISNAKPIQYLGNNL